MPIREYLCPCGTQFEFLYRTGNTDPVCPRCQCTNLEELPSSFSSQITAIHTSERPVIYRNPRTGEIRYPGSAAQDMHPNYVRQGYVKEYAFTTFAERDAFEKNTGRIHERSHYDPGQATAERDLDVMGEEFTKVGEKNFADFQRTKVKARLTL